MARSITRWLVSCSRRIGAVALALVIATTALASGGTYLWCVPMARVMPSCCMRASRDALLERGREAPALERLTYEVRSLGTLPSTRLAEAAELGPVGLAPDAASVSPVPVRDRTWATIRGSSRHVSRPNALATGPPSASARCALLSVFRC